MIKADIVADSVGTNGIRITTFVLTYPRFIHAEFMTHRVFSRNASSSRAIPVKKQIQMVIDNPVIPLAFTKNKAGMQGGEALSGDQEAAAIAAWLEGRDRAVESAQKLADLEVHKQYANRILEPYAHITVVATATDLDNWFALRCHYMAQPEICELAMQMLEKYNTSQPQLTPEGSWHLPFIDLSDMALIAATDDEETLDNEMQELIKCSVARCARVSYLNHDGAKPSREEDLKLYDRLLGAAPVHASPAEHQAQAMGRNYPAARSGNFRGWNQYRKSIQGENVIKFTGPVLTSDT
jgi:thymidylate synthase ThyX